LSAASRVVLDTQVLLRGAVARTESLTGRIYEAWLDDRFILLASEPVLAEVDAVLRRPEVLRKVRITVLETRALVALLRRRMTLVTPLRRIRLCRDSRATSSWSAPSGPRRSGSSPLTAIS
jgi:putative PIN family toxin of toxin-antitoxin system